MSDGPLTPEQILDAAEAALRRYGPAKTTVLDVARELEVSHGSVYRHYPSKAALRDAVARRWLHEITEPLQTIADRDEPPPRRLRRWLDHLITTKRARAQQDPELFATYVQLTAQARGVITEHVNTLTDQLAHIITDGVAQDTFTTDEPRATARAVFDATSRFHNPAHAAQWSDQTIDNDYENVWKLVLKGLQTRS